MCGDLFATSLKNRLVALFVRIINELPEAEKRAEAIWRLRQAAEVLAAPGGAFEKARRLDHLLESSKVAAMLVDLVRMSLGNYRDSSLPEPLKAAMASGLMALPLMGMQGLGLAALAGPSLLLAFLGAAGIISILDKVASHCDRPVLGAQERISQGSAVSPPEKVRVAVRPTVNCHLPRDEVHLRRTLQEMNPFDFERHVMGFFSRSGMEAWVTAKTNDMGVDGYARHPRGLIVVQCKRHAPRNLIGRPVIQQMKGVVAEHNALRGYLVTTSRFSDKARHSAKMSDQLVLVDMPELVRWHMEPPSLCA